jgi:hypothetical protein
MDPRANDRREPPDPPCRDCQHYWITYEAQHPWGCRAFGIASTRLPAAVVREATGKPCDAFELKERLRK